MEEDVEKILSKVKETMDRDDIRKLGILPIHYPRTICYEECGIRIEGCDYSAGGVQLEQLKEIIEDVLDSDYGLEKYIDEVLDNPEIMAHKDTIFLQEIRVKKLKLLSVTV